MRGRSGRVLVVGRGSPERGGIPTFLDTLMGSALAGERELVLVNLARPDVREGGRMSGGNAMRSVSDAVRLARLARRGDIVHLHTAFAPAVTVMRAGLLMLAARLRGATVVAHVHGGRVVHWATSARRRRLVRVCLAPATRAVAVASGGYDVLVAACGPAKVALMPNGVDTVVFSGEAVAHEPPRVLFAGGLTPRKGVLDLMQASAALGAAVPHELWLAGGTPDEGTAAEAQVRAAAGPQVRFLGPVPPEAMADLYREVDVFCLPSWYEAMPLSVLEAMASGLPVVATRVGDVERVVTTESAVLVEPHSPEELAAALREVLVDPDRRAAMGRAGRRVVAERFSLSRLEDDLRRLYDDLAGSSA